MNSSTAPHGFRFSASSGARPLPLRAAQPARESSTPAVRATWLDRLAEWAERQPMHHRMGSYTRIR